MDTPFAARHCLSVGFDGELTRFVHETLEEGLAQLQKNAEATPDSDLRRKCKDALERLWMRRQALVRTLSLPARPQGVPGKAVRRFKRRPRVDTTSTVELDIASAHVLRALFDAALLERRVLQLEGKQVADMRVSAWPPAPASCAAALRWAIEWASPEYAVRLELMRLGTRVLVPLFAAVCRRQLAGRCEGEPQAKQSAPEDLLEAALPGRWFRMVLFAQWADARLTWRSANGSFFMFSSRLEGRSHAITRGSLEKLIERGQFKPLSYRPSGFARSESRRA